MPALVFIIDNWPERQLHKQVERWNLLDKTNEREASIGKTTNFLDLHLQNKCGILITTVYHKFFSESYYSPFNSIHPVHRKKNNPFAMLLRAIQYCSTFDLFVQERESFRMSFIINRYRNKLIEEQFQNMFKKFNEKQTLTVEDYDEVRKIIIFFQSHEKLPTDYENNICIHLTLSSSMRQFPKCPQFATRINTKSFISTQLFQFLTTAAHFHLYFR